MSTHKSIKFGLTAAILLSASAVSDAADVVRGPASRPLPIPFYNWTGFYAGAHVGAGWADAGSSGFLGGAQAGFNYQINHWVLGVEADIAGTTIDDTVNARSVFPGGSARAHADVSLDWVSTVAPRVGYAFDRWLVYGKFGGAWAHASANVSAGVGDRDRRVGIGGTADRTASGWVLGVGTEYAFGKNWTAKFEYNMMDFGSDSPFADNKFHVFKAGINYRFGGLGGF